MTAFGLTTYIASGIAFAGLSVLLATSWRGRIYGGLLLFATSVTAIWAFLLALNTRHPVPMHSLYLAELCRDAAWLTFLVGVIRLLGKNSATRVLRWGIHVLWAVILIGSLVLAGLAGPGLDTITSKNAFIVSAFLLSLGALILVEQLYRNATVAQRRELKYLCLGIGGLFVYDLFLYSHGLFFREIEPVLWSARGAASVLVIPLIAVAARRNPQWSLDVFVSRQMVFYSASTISVGFYLIAIALGGSYIQLYGGEWGPAIRIAFFFGSALVLLTMLLSERLRARLRVFLSKHFYSNRYDYREEWLRLIATMSESEGSGALAEPAIRAMARIVDSTEGGLWIRRSGSQFVPSGGELGGPSEDNVMSDSAFVRFLDRRKWIIDLEDYRRDPRLYDGLALPEWLIAERRAWLVVPLVLEGKLYGFMVIGQPGLRRQLGWEDHDLLKTVGRQIATYLALGDTERRLTESRQFEAFNRLTAFIMHDLKNLIAQQSLVVRNAVRHKGNPDFFEDAIKTIENSVGRMQRLLSQLQHGDTNAGAQSADLRSVCERALEHCADREPVPELIANGSDLKIRANPERLAHVVAHLVKNAQEASDSSGQVRVTLSRIGRDAVIEIVDNGVGMEASFVRQHLFRPFDSTKDSQGMGIGAYQAKEFVRLAGGRISVDSEPGRGTVMTVVLPLSSGVQAEKESERVEAGE